MVLDPYAGGAPLLAAVTCVMTLAAFGIGAASEPPAPPPEYEPPPSSPSPSRVHIVRPILVGDPGVRGAGGMEGRSSSRSTSSAWNAGFVGVDCGSVVIVGTDDPIRSVHSASTSVPARDDSASGFNTSCQKCRATVEHNKPNVATITIGGDDDARYVTEENIRRDRRGDAREPTIASIARHVIHRRVERRPRRRDRRAGF